MLFDYIIKHYVDRKNAFRWDPNKPEEHYIEPNFGMEYLGLCRKKQWIQNWPQVERQFQKYFNPNMYPCFESAVQNNQHADIVCLLNQLMENLVNYEKDSQYYKLLLDKWLKSLIENKVYLNMSNDVFDALFFNVEQIKKLPIWEEKELQALTVSFDTLKSQWCFTKQGTFFYVKEDKSSECERANGAFDLF